jgi:putative PIN family toxin of toxin-antitoxin system
VSRRVVFDTNTIVSALLFAGGRLAWLRSHWREGGCTPLISRTTVNELTRVLGYPKFRLSPDDRLELLADYLPFCETIESVAPFQTLCRDRKDQPFLDLAASGQAELLITGDNGLLTLAEQTTFVIETPEAYRHRIVDAERNQ